MFILSTNCLLYQWGNSQQSKVLDQEIYDDGPVLISLEKFQNLEYDEKIIDIQTGNNHILVLTSEGKVFSWGLNNFGQLGLEDRKQLKELNYPQQLNFDTKNFQYNFKGKQQNWENGQNSENHGQKNKENQLYVSKIYAKEEQNDIINCQNEQIEQLKQSLQEDEDTEITDKNSLQDNIMKELNTIIERLKKGYKQDSNEILQLEKEIHNTELEENEIKKDIDDIQQKLYDLQKQKEIFLQQISQLGIKNFE
ncbi:Regulator of chromosome condensation 1/beta-lactamase-inhibitor protein II [Pseudocohnilembus persalinus]|uniref:Regulator of chromosome condensation 1/beta-lactamase-inhibitor protein II n=1 Tax=Pseudocohnilembus persalinus TaxID=266149 RepID=A0A0V0QFQ8_PSEPJ|nr:Regulator of chromosome condensation 1/beta-lactamase-inhibitor protein II [Pseudocohnilembus persalinus]|eukprot:KRX01033.1 Regulator of chromosome condensation 1/beta-lactamase-inhibitor protein II [Pseudocohnilembus persalinus]